MSMTQKNRASRETVSEFPNHHKQVLQNLLFRSTKKKKMNVTTEPELEPTSYTDQNEQSTSFNCSICGKEFSNEKRYFGHLRIHSGEVLWSCNKCPQSDVAFDSQSRLRMHENLCHTLVRPYKCSKCDNVFDRASQLDYHKRSIHLGEKSQVCQICGKGFFRKTDLRTHLNVHLGTNQSICEICGRKFNHVSNLIRHCRTHAGSKPYPCTICGKRFTQISSLARHKRIHSRETSFSGNRDDQASANEDSPKIEQKKTLKRQHYCRICGESFQFMVLLRQHERLHSKAVDHCGNKSYGKNHERETIHNENEQEFEQTDEMLSSTENPGQSSASDWGDFHAGEERVRLDNTEEPTEEEPNNSIRDHLLELDRKMNAIEIESERDVSISISDILSPYNCDEIELANADGLEPKLYENPNTVNKHNALEKEYDIVQCLNGVDFTSNLDSQLLENAAEKNAEKFSSSFLKSPLKDPKTSKSIPHSSPTKDQYNKCLHVEGSQLYIEICESEYLKSSNLHALELQDMENVALFQEVFDPSEDDESKSSRTNAQKIAVVKSSKIDENTVITEDTAAISIETAEPSLRLVQTETGEQFYELLINNQCTDDFKNLTMTEESEGKTIDEVIENNSPLPCEEDCRTDKVQEQLLDSDKLEIGASCNEFFQLLPNTESYREIHSSAQNDTSMPMVRLVQNEDGEQFFELIREPLEYERNREDRIVENPRDDKFPEVSFISDNQCDINNTKAATISSNSAGKRDKKECSSENLRLAKDRTRKFQCTECDKWFSTAYNFKQHTGTHFSDQQKFQCKDCGLSFAWKSTLNKHLAGNHRPDGPQKFVCEICPKVYSTLSQVNEHVKRDHLKERNHVCPHCGKSFFKKFDLKTHSRTHTNERPYVCGACGKRFHHQSHIIRHERIHSGERPYACDICQRTFTQPSSLKAHRQRHRDVKIDILEYRMDEDDPLSLAVQ